MSERPKVPSVHEEVTVARERMDLAAMRTLMDAAPAAAAGTGGSGGKTQMLAQTLLDPSAQERAQAMRDAFFGTAPTAPSTAPKANLAQTMMMGGDSAPSPAADRAPSRSDRPSATPEEAHERSRPEASPLSRSVLAPSSWRPPPLASRPEAPAAVDVSRVVPVGAGASAPPQALSPQAPVPAHGNPALRTMLGMPTTDLPPPPGPSGPPPNAHRTMLGVAQPGIAPAPVGPGPVPALPPPAASPSELRSKHATMLGVALPGIAPTFEPSGSAPAPRPQASQAPPMPSQVKHTALGMSAPPELAIVPRPRTLIEEPLPAAPQLPAKKGISALAVVGLVSVVVLALGGAGVFVATRGGGALEAVPQLDETGKESLKLGCPTCPDGTTIALGAASATVTAGTAVLPLPAPLSIGDNDLAVKIDRPGAGRDEEVKVHVPVAYRVRADLSTLSARPPAITVRVEATPGSTATVNDQPIPLDASGRGSYAVDLSKETEGSGEAKPLERKIAFAITPKGQKPESGELTARTAIVPLALDAPGRELITDKGSAAVAGQTRPGTAITVDGQAVPVDTQGRFGVRVELAAAGERPLEIVASAPPLAPRIAKVKVTRVASLEAASKAEDAQAPLGFDAFGADPAARAGQKAVVEGEVVEARVTAGHTVLIVEEKKRCPKGAACLVRVLHGDEDKAARGDTVRAYGRVLGVVTASGRSMPDLEASLVVPLKASGR